MNGVRLESYMADGDDVILCAIWISINSINFFLSFFYCFFFFLLWFLFFRTIAKIFLFNSFSELGSVTEFR